MLKNEPKRQHWVLLRELTSFEELPKTLFAFFRRKKKNSRKEEKNLKQWRKNFVQLSCTHNTQKLVEIHKTCVQTLILRFKDHKILWAVLKQLFSYRFWLEILRPSFLNLLESRDSSIVRAAFCDCLSEIGDDVLSRLVVYMLTLASQRSAMMFFQGW